MRIKKLAKIVLPERGYQKLRKMYRRPPWRKDSTQIDMIAQVLTCYARNNRNVRFIQIGSNDGIKNDPLCRFIMKKGWKGIMIEPINYIFENLKSNYSSHANDLIFENAAISKDGKKTKFYRLNENTRTELPYWYDQLGSFRKEVVLKHEFAIPNIEELIVEEMVDTLTFRDLLAKHNYYDVNLIHIDTEGYDLEILKQIEFSKLKLDIVIFEHTHLSKSDYQRAKEILIENSYAIYADSLDTLAISKTIQNELLQTRKWKQLTEKYVVFN